MASRVIPASKSEGEKASSATPTESRPTTTTSLLDRLPHTFNVQPRALFGGLLLLTAAAVGSYASQLSLGPVYGDIPSSLHHSKICGTIFAAVWAGKPLFRRIIRKPLLLLPLVALYVPVIQRTLFSHSEEWGARMGPVYTEALSFYPTLFLAVLGVACLWETPSIVLDIVPAGASYAIFKTARDFLPGYLFHKMGTSWIYTRCGLTHFSAIIYTLLSPSALLLAAAPGLFHSFTINPACTTAAAAMYLNATLVSSNYTVLAHTESATGYVSVMENSYHKYRVLRCDHSLLGGEWIAAPPGYEHVDSGQKEPIYGVFVTLEAVRLVRPAPKTPVGVKPKALMIGLGIGTSQNGLMRQGVDVHIVEIDPAVYKYSKEYFGLLPHHTAHITDAVSWVHEQANKPEDERLSYEFIIHDVFTGGAAPSALLTREMMEGMKVLLRSDGVVAINYAGDLKLKPAKMIIETARTVFGQCKVFREDYPENDDKDVDFTNMVIFCTLTPNTPFRFRTPTHADFLGTYARQEFLFPKYEIDVEKLFGVDEEGGVRRYGVLDAKSLPEFDAFQKESAVHHWEIMRTVVPREGWEAY